MRATISSFASWADSSSFVKNQTTNAPQVWRYARNIPRTTLENWEKLALRDRSVISECESAWSLYSTLSLRSPNALDALVSREQLCDKSFDKSLTDRQTDRQTPDWCFILCAIDAASCQRNNRPRCWRGELWHRTAVVYTVFRKKWYICFSIYLSQFWGKFYETFSEYPQVNMSTEGNVILTKLVKYSLCSDKKNTKMNRTRLISSWLTVPKNSGVNILQPVFLHEADT